MNDNDDLAHMRGLLIGLAIGAACWLLVASIWWAVVSMSR